MESISIEVLPSSILSLSSQRGRCRTARLQDYRVQEYWLPSPLNVMYYVRVSLRTVKIFLAPHLTERVVGNLYIYLITSQETPRTPLWTTIWRGTRTCRTRRPSLRRLLTASSCPPALRTEVIIRPSYSNTTNSIISSSNSISWGGPLCTCRPRICTIITIISTRV